MAARRFNRESVDSPELGFAQGPVAMSCLGGEIVEEAMLLDGYDSHLQLLGTGRRRPRAPIART